MSGDVPDAIRQLAEHKFFKQNASFASSRGQHQTVAAKILLVEFRGGFVDTRKTSLDRFAMEAEEIQNQDLRAPRNAQVKS